MQMPSLAELMPSMYQLVLIIDGRQR